MQFAGRALGYLLCFAVGWYLPRLTRQIRRTIHSMRDFSSDRALCRIINLSDRLNAEHSRQCGDYMHALARDLEHQRRMETLRGQI